MSDTAAPLLLTPGPLTVSDRVRAAMMRDWGSRDEAFLALTARVRAEVSALAGADPDRFVTVPMQGSGTFAVEAMLAAFAPMDAPTLICENGAYGRRMADILRRLGRPYRMLHGPETEPTDLDAVARALADGPKPGCIAVVQCETTTGCLNPVSQIAALAREAGVPLLVDAMSGFGGLPLDMAADGLTAVAASSNKCLQGVPGLGLVVCDRAALADAADRAPSLSLDLVDQARGFEATGEWRFTPPTHVVAALAEALDELAEEGGPTARLARYGANLTRLLAGMRDLGFRPLLAAENQAPIIATFADPSGEEGWPGFSFARFYGGLKDRGFVIYPGKLTQAASFRVGCIGAITPADIDAFLIAARDVLDGMRP